MDSADRLNDPLASKSALDVSIVAAPALARSLHKLRSWQARRLASTYQDLGREPRRAARPLTAASYADAYRGVNWAEERQRQIDLTIAVGLDLDRIVRRAWIGVALKAAHVPAHTAGYGALQDFLERGFAAFRKMRGAGHLLAAIQERETQMMRSLLGGTTPPLEKTGVQADAPS